MILNGLIEPDKQIGSLFIRFFVAVEALLCLETECIKTDVLFTGVFHDTFSYLK